MTQQRGRQASVHARSGGGSSEGAAARVTEWVGSGKGLRNQYRALVQLARDDADIAASIPSKKPNRATPPRNAPEDAVSAF